MDGAGAGAKQKRAADADAATANPTALLNLSDDVLREMLACVPADDLLALDHTHSRTHHLVGEALAPTIPRGGVAAEPSSTGGGNPGGGETTMLPSAGENDDAAAAPSSISDERGPASLRLRRPSDKHIVTSMALVEWARALGWRSLWLERDQVWLDRHVTRGGCIAVLQDVLQGGATISVGAAARAGDLKMVKYLVGYFEQKDEAESATTETKEEGAGAKEGEEKEEHLQRLLLPAKSLNNLAESLINLLPDDAERLKVKALEMSREVHGAGQGKVWDQERSRLGNRVDGPFFTNAAGGGWVVRVETDQYARKRHFVGGGDGYHRGGAACADAAGSGRADIVRWLRDRGAKWDARSCAEAAMGGHIDVLRFLLGNDCPQGNHLLFWGVKSGCIEVIKYLVEQGYPWGTSPWRQPVWCTAAGGSIEVLQWLYDKSSDIEGFVPWTMEACYAAAEAGNLDNLQFLLNNGGPLVEAVGAAEGVAWERSVDMWLHAVHDPNDDAVGQTSLAIIKYLVEQEWPREAQEYDPHQLSEVLIGRLATTGSVEVMQFLVENGFHVNVNEEDLCHSVAGSGHVGAMQYLVENHGLIVFGGTSPNMPTETAANNGHLPMLRYMLENGGQQTKELFQIAQWGSLDVVKYLVESGCPRPYVT